MIHDIANRSDNPYVRYIKERVKALQNRHLFTLEKEKTLKIRPKRQLFLKELSFCYENSLKK